MSKFISRDRGLGLIVAGEVILVIGICLSKLGLGLGIAGFLCFMDGVAVLAEVSVPAHPMPDMCDGLFVRDTMGDGTVMYYPAEPEDIAHFGRGVDYDELHEEAGAAEH